MTELFQPIFGTMEFSGFYRQLVDALVKAHGVDIYPGRFASCRKHLKRNCITAQGTNISIYDYVSRSTGTVSHQDRPFEGALVNIERRYRETTSDYFKEKMARYMVVRDVSCVSWP